jgi:rubrerythrin
MMGDPSVLGDALSSYQGMRAPKMATPQQDEEDKAIEQIKAFKRGTPAAANPGYSPTAGQGGNVFGLEPGMFGNVIASGGGMPSYQSNGQSPGLNVDQLKAKGINLPEPGQQLTGNYLTSTNIAPMGTGYKAGDLLYTQTTSPMDSQAIARRMRAGQHRPLADFMPAAEAQHNELLKTLVNSQTAKDIEAQKAAGQTAKETGNEEKVLDRSFAAAYSQTRADLEKTDPTFVKLNAEDQDTAIKQKMKLEFRASPEILKRIEGMSSKGSVKGAGKEPEKITPTADVQGLNPLLERAVPGASETRPGSIRASDLITAGLGRMSTNRLTPEDYSWLSQRLAERGGGTQGMLDTIGEELARRAVASGQNSFDTSQGKVGVVPAHENYEEVIDPMTGATAPRSRQTGWHLTVGGKPVAHIPTNRVNTLGYFGPGAFMFQNQINERAAANPFLAELMAPILQRIASGQ